ncbi:MAG: phosphoribosylanthranilate isomerase [Verrucomicrobiota bacterium]
MNDFSEKPNKVKVCGMTREADIEHALNCGADYIGMILYPKSPRAISVSRAEELLQVIPEGKGVAVDVNTGTDDLMRYRDAGFGSFQIHVEFTIGFPSLAAWSGMVGREQLWLVPKIPPREEFPQVVLEFADSIMIDTYSTDAHGGTGEVGDWTQFNYWATLYNHKQWILAGGLNPENIRKAAENTEADVLDLSSGVESEPGIKDHAKISALFAALKGAA